MSRSSYQPRRNITAALAIIIGLVIGLMIKKVTVGLLLGLILGLTASNLLSRKDTE